MIVGIEEIYIPDGITLSTATVTMQNMGDQTIETTLSINRDIVPDFSKDWVIRYNGADFIHPLRAPQASKSNDKFNPEYPLTFYHKGIWDLKRKFFFSFAPIESSTAVPDKYEASLALNVVDFVDAYKQVLAYHYGDYITVDFNAEPTEPYDEETVAISISYTKMWDLLSAFYTNYNVAWWIEPNKSATGKYVIRIGYDRALLSHQFAYGFDGGLLKIERQIQSSDIINILLGRGGEKNLPYRYFKKKAEDSDGGGDEATFRADPDWIPELENIPMYQGGLRDINFRYWIQGWKDAHYRYDTETGDISETGDHAVGTRRYAESEHWAYDIGFTAVTFDPVEYVKDDASIAKYGELWGGLQKVDDIYPSIQGVFLDNQGRADQIVDVSEPKDETESSEPPSVKTEELLGGTAEATSVPSGESRQFIIESDEYFNIEEGYEGNLSSPSASAKAYRMDGGTRIDLSSLIAITQAVEVVAINQSDDELSPITIPAGNGYRYKAIVTATNNSPYAAHITIGTGNVTLTQSVIKESSYNTFEVWIKNLWETEKETGESNKQYAERVWTPILGNHLGEEAAVVFSSGFLSISEDYEFMLAKVPEFDTSKVIRCKDADGNEIDVRSHWKLTLKRSDAEYDTTGKWLPNAETHANAGEYFFFVGIDLPHQYVVWAEQRLNAYKLQQLDDTSEINPTWTIELSKIRINSLQAGETSALIKQLQAGADVLLYSKWFISNPEYIDEGETYRTTIQTLTLKYEAPKKDSPGLLPSVSITLADTPSTTTSSISLLQGSVNALTSRINSMSSPYVLDVIKSTDNVTTPTDYNVLSAKKSERTLLSSKSADIANGHITFNQGLTTEASSVLKKAVQLGEAFISGKTGVGGRIDERANAELESLILRSWLEVPEIRCNRVTVNLGDLWLSSGGGIIESVEIDEDAQGNPLMTGTITLKLEDGEIGAIEPDDICMGIFHDFFNQSNNAAADTDDSRGNITHAGFGTSYFRVTEIISTDGTNAVFKYALRPVSERWAHTLHPTQAMHFAAYGNFTDKDRQRSAYQTRTYTRYLKDVDDWEFDIANIAMQFGDLTNLSIFGKDMSGYSAYLQNVYFSGTLEKINIEVPETLEITTNTGDFFIADNETLTLTCKVMRGFTDLTNDVLSWQVTRDSTDAAADAAWNAAHPMYTSVLTLTQADIGATTLNASSLFTITANGDGWTATKTIAARTLRLPATLSMRFVSEYGEYDTFISFGDTVQFRAVIEDALRNDYTADYDQWRIVRHNGDGADDVAADSVWNATRAAITSSGAFSIEWSSQHDDLQAERATFEITAQKGTASSTAITGTLNI